MSYLNFHTHRPSLRHECAVQCLSPHRFEQRQDSPFLTYYAVGIHPWQAHQADEAEFECLTRAVQHPAVVAVGEVGLDRACSVPYEVQLEVFRRQALLAEQCHKPLVLHCVRAVDDVLAVRKALKARQPWIWHGFRGGDTQLRALLPHGFYFGFGGHYRAEALAACPLSRLLPETDESPGGIELHYRGLAQQLNLSVHQLQQTTESTFRELFPAAEPTLPNK